LVHLKKKKEVKNPINSPPKWKLRLRIQGYDLAFIHFIMDKAPAVSSAARIYSLNSVLLLL